MASKFHIQFDMFRIEKENISERYTLNEVKKKFFIVIRVQMIKKSTIFFMASLIIYTFNVINIQNSLLLINKY